MKKSCTLIVAVLSFVLFVGVLHADSVYFGWGTSATLDNEDFENDPTFDANTKFFAKFTDPVRSQTVEIPLNKSTVSDDGGSVTITWNKKVMLYNKKSLKGKQYSMEILDVNSSPVQDLQLEIYTDGGLDYEKDVYLANPLIQTITSEDNTNYTLTGTLLGPQKVKIFQEYYTDSGNTRTYGYKNCKVSGYQDNGVTKSYDTHTVEFALPNLKTGQTATGYFILENKIGITTATKSKTYDEYLEFYNGKVTQAKAAFQFDENNSRPSSGINNNLFAINSYDTDLIWDENKEHILVITWKTSGELSGGESNWVDNLEIGKEYSNSYSPMFVAISPEIRNWGKKYKLALQTDENIRYKLAQILGMPPHIANDETYNVFMELWVKPQYLIRPTPDPEITDQVAEINFDYTNNGILTVNDTYKTWLQNKLIISYNETDPWPFTGFGYSYYWSNTDISTYGISEYIISSPETVVEGKYTVNRLVPTKMYLSEDDDAYKTPGKYY